VAVLGILGLLFSATAAQSGEIRFTFGLTRTIDACQTAGQRLLYRVDGRWYESPMADVKEITGLTCQRQALPSQVSSGQVDAPVLVVGDEWAFRWESPLGKGTFVWTVAREEAVEGVEYYVLRSDREREVYWRKADLAYRMDKVRGAVEAQSLPPVVRYTWPFVVGKTWDQRFATERPLDRQKWETTQKCEVEREEMTTVPAGMFRTLKVVCRTARAATNPILSERWYAPAVKCWVRERVKFSYGIQERELTSFKLTR
jgi:hypothetical protein